MTFRLSICRRLWNKASESSPESFRRRLRLAADDDAPFADRLQPWQRRDFAALDAAWLRLSHGRAGGRREPVRRAWIERPRGHAKTSDIAVQLAWILLFARRPVSGLVAAAGRDQATLVWEAARRIARANPGLCDGLVFHKHVVSNPANDSRLDVISSDVHSSWGALPDFVICDELCHWEKPDMWFSLLSSAAKRPDCVLVVLTNAGVGRGWQWDARETARARDDWYFSSLDGTQAPWIDERTLDEQRALLPRPVFDRLWQNLWQHSDGEFVTLAEAEACRDPGLAYRDHAEPGRTYVAAIDYAEKHDYTVGVVLHREGRRLVVDRMDVAVPRPDRPVLVAWVEDWIRRVAAGFHRVTFVCDEYQLLGTIQRLEGTYDIRRFQFGGGRGNHALALALRQLVVHRDVAWYPACGQLPDTERRDDLETELASLLLHQSASGWCRIDHHRDGLHHDDRAFALGAACLHALDDTRGDWLQVTPPTTTGDFAW